MVRLKHGHGPYINIAASLLYVTSITQSSLGYELDIHSQKAHELEIFHESSLTSACTYLTFRSTQTHKALKDFSDVYKVNGKLVEGSDEHGMYEKIYSYDTDLLWDTAISSCGPLTSWSFPVHIAPEVKNTLTTIDEHENQNVLSFPNFKASPRPAPITEIVPIIQTGRPDNRIDFVFLGDGYTSSERDKFMLDARKLAFDLSENQTFATVKPLLNFWAAFSPSKESGIGSGGKPKDTPFGLYRDGTELRAVYYAKPEVAHATCIELGDVCDYPILLGNDPLYGGLGGRFTVTTASELNGALVLRHELGHSVIREGEEYDGGFAYYGPNAANLTESFKWAHWLTDQTSVPREERSVMPMQAYPWTMLNVSTPWSITFNSSGLYSRFVVRFSLSGLPSAEDLSVTLNGDDLDWKPKPGLGLDRWHYDIFRNETLVEGVHNVSFSLQNEDLEGFAQLCSVEVIEFGSDDEFNSTPGYIGAFPTFSDKNQTTYRPTNEDCLMRIVTTPNFCKVCTEGLWHEILSRVSLMDSLSIECPDDTTPPQRNVSVQLVDLHNPKNHAAYVIDWSKNGVELPEFANKTSVISSGEEAWYNVRAQFITDEVRVDPHGYLQAEVSFLVPACENML